MKKLLLLSFLLAGWATAQDSAPAASEEVKSEVKAEEAKPETKAEATKTEEAKGEEAQADAKAEEVKTEATKPEAQAEEAKTEEAKPEVAKPEEAKAEAGKDAETPEESVLGFLRALKDGKCEALIAQVELTADEQKEEMVADCKKDIETLKLEFVDIADFKVSKVEIIGADKDKAIVEVEYLGDDGKSADRPADKFTLQKGEKGWKTSF